VSTPEPHPVPVTPIAAAPEAGDDEGSKLTLKEILGDLAAPVGVVVTTVGGLAATGVLGRVERNHTGLFQTSLALVIAGGLMLLLSRSLRRHSPDAKLESGLARYWSHVRGGSFGAGIVLAAIGVLVAVVATVSTASQTERPMITLNVDPTHLDVSATVKVSNVPSNRRMVLVVDGLTDSDSGETYNPTTVYQAYVGPDGDGRIDLPVKLRLAPGFKAVGVKAYVSEPHKDTGKAGQVCTPYPRRVSTFAEARGDVGPGCVIVALPQTS
jgi:hypothetical protein